MSLQTPGSSAGKVIRITPRKETPELTCDWNHCAYTVRSEYDFYKHVTDHINETEIGVNEDGEEVYECRWSECPYDTQNSKELIRHIKFHGYHTRLKALGAVVKEKKKLPVCTYVEYEDFVLPNQTDPLVCFWGGCGEEKSGQPEFIDHVLKEHLIPCNEKKNGFTCQWADCKTVTSSCAKLFEHVRVHTGEKVVACPTCGYMFANLTKFADHCNRQLERREFQCTHCLGFFPNERILTSHKLQHVHHYKCSFCDMTCYTPAKLATHIRYRHLNYKAFTCPTCCYRFKTQADLRNHALSHDANKRFFCEEPVCDFSAKTQQTLVRHYGKVHSNISASGVFSCHLCEKKYTRGANLTKHLLNSHGISKPDGYSRFIYRNDEDGLYRLQTTRLESLEVTEVIEQESLNMKELTSQLLTDDEDSDDGEYEQHVVEIDVLDESGKVMKSEPVIAKRKCPPDAKVVAVAT